MAGAASTSGQGPRGGTPHVRVRAGVIDALVSHARHDPSRECCGLLLGREGIIERAVPARNVEARPTRYRIDPRDHFAAIKAARASAREVIGAYHSHPDGGVEPSPTDMAESIGPGFLYVIVALRGRPIVRGYRLWPERFERVELAVEEG